MDGVHDTGGRQGFGPVRPRPSGEARPAPFGARWEARVFACVMGLGGVAVRSSDQFRHAVERVRPEAYLTHGYYGRWLGGLETLVLEAGLLERAAIDARALALGAAPDAVVAAQPEVQPARPPVRLPPLQQPRDPQALPARAHALRPLGRRRPSRPATGCARGHMALMATPACRPMRAAASARSSRGTMAGCTRTRTRTCLASIPNISTPSRSPARSCGARMRSRGCR